MQAQNERQIKGQEIARLEGAIQRVNEYSYRVKSQSGKGDYEVISSEFGWGCSCPDHTYRSQKCKHIHAVEFSLTIRKKVESQIVIAPVPIGNCPRCKSERVVRHGVRKNKSGTIQRYFCKECKFWFTLNIGFEKMHASPQMITTAMQLYFSGESLRNVQKFLHLQGIKISHVSVYKWIGKYVTLMQEYLDQITPQVSGTWRTDELYLKVKGNTKYLYALMDDETRFWIAQQIADTKYTQDVRPLFKEGKEVAGKKPDMLISDGAHNFHEAYLKEFWSKVPPRTSHIRHIHIAGDMNNNKMERMNGEVRDREKVMRGLKKQDTAVLKGYQLYHNYFRPHEGLGGQTPAEAANIKIEGRNKWMTVIQNASVDLN
ncbi:DDE-type integrase/transposase/recombinase [Nitrososphaera sp.]|uniref:DDE-type integrase/transposase/recombinase n=1 Tax=Nitrososphaera sp. TaxID=1971748 RepID=UPI0025DA41E9|nr:DDE-type integrase/transposase/recombinase [Nitrososphaera sp.]